MTAENNNDNNTQAPPVIGPGEKLRTARLAAGLDKDRVAAALHLQQGQIDEIERDHYDGFAARVFVRGYLRNYARLVAISPDEVLTAFDAVSPDPEQPALKRVGTHRPQVSSRHGGIRLVSWLLVLGLAGLFGVWWAGYLELNGNGSVSQPQQGAVSESQPSEESPQAPGTLLLPPLSSEPVPAVESGSVAEPQPMVEQGNQSVSLPALESAAPASDTGAAPEVDQASSPVAEGNIVLTLSGSCWVEVRATDGSFKLLGTFDAGTRKVLGGNPPYRILLGNAGAASLTVDGQPFDLAPHTRQQIARFELDPAAL